MSDFYNKFWNFIINKENREEIFDNSSFEEKIAFKGYLKRIKLDSFGGENNLEEVRKEIKSEISRRSKSKRIAIYKHMFRYASIVVLIALIGFVFNYISTDSFSKRTPVASNEIKPKNEIILKLSDGKKISLSSSNMDSLVDKNFNIAFNKESKTLDYTKENIHADKIIYNEIIVPRAADFSLKLSDGSTVILNSETKFKYPLNFTGKKREVFVDGEAYFRVTKDKAKPFIVNVKDVNVEVLGTSFNVNSYKENSAISTTLVEGKVKVSTDKGKECAVLRPNEQANYKGGNITSKAVDVRNYVSWVKGQFFFEDMALENVMIQIERWYDVDIFFMSEDLKDFEFTGVIERSCSLEKMIELIESIVGCDIRIKKKTLIIQKN